MNKPLNFNWKAEVEFHGSAEEFAKITDVLKDTPVAFKFSPHPFPFPGLWPVDWRVVVGEARAKQFLEGTNAISVRFLKDIAGGIRDPHLHIGDQVVLLDQARFKEIIGEVSRELAARRVEQMTDYIDVMEGINPLVDV